jgi:hypothetical protein
MSRRYHRYALLFLACFCGLPAAIGCNTLGVNSASPLANTVEGRAGSKSETENNSYSVQFQTTNGKPQVKSLPVEGEMFVQDALEKSGAYRTYHRFNVDLVRMTPQGTPHRMTVTVDRSKRKVEPQCNYHVRPGDKLIVVEDTTTVVDDMLQSLGGPFSSKSKAPRPMANVSG